jgi:hypothetical protein
MARTPPAGSRSNRSKTSSRTSRPSPSARRLRGRHSVANKRAQLRASYRQRPDLFEIHYTADTVQLALTAAGTPLFDGAWQTRLILADGRELPVVGAWDPAVWLADSDGDYLELQLHLTDELRLDRSLFLSRDGGLAFVSETLISLPGAPEVVAFESTCTLNPKLQASAVAGGRECQLKTRGFQARLHSLSASSPTAEGVVFSATDGVLRVRQPCSEGNGFAPLLIDWHPLRARKPAVVKPVTVSEQRQIVSPATAVAARWQCGTEHLLCYRSLRAPDLARAVLGLHTWYELVLARLTKPGTYPPLIQIEAPEEPTK